MLDIKNDWEARAEHTNNIGFVKITPQLVDVIRKYSPLLEVGAGTGALANAIREAGGDIIATDSGTWKWNTDPVNVQKMGAEAAVKNIIGDRNLLLSWPMYKHSYADKAIKALPSGRYFIYIGEDDGGCCANDAFFNRLNRDFEKIEDSDVDPWYGLHDHLTVYRKK